MAKDPKLPKKPLPQAMFETRRRVTFKSTQPSMAKQEFKKECDVNTIVRGFERTGVISHINTHEGAFGDYINAPESYQEALNTVMDAQNDFDALPSAVRAHFHNDPARFMNFQNDEEGMDLMRKHKLLAAKEPEKAPASQPKVEQPKEGSELKGQS